MADERTHTKEPTCVNCHRMKPDICMDCFNNKERMTGLDPAYYRACVGARKCLAALQATETYLTKTQGERPLAGWLWRQVQDALLYATGAQP